MSRVRWFVEAFVDEFDFRALPLYVGLTVLTGWLGVLSIYVLAESGVSRAELGLFVPAVQALMYLFVLTPFSYAVIGTARRWWIERGER